MRARRRSPWWYGPEVVSALAVILGICSGSKEILTTETLSVILTLSNMGPRGACSVQPGCFFEAMLNIVR
jgi:hypothetical protein